MNISSSAIKIPSLFLPWTDTAPVLTRLNGLRLIHTHLSEESLTQEDLLDLALLRLDLSPRLTSIPTACRDGSMRPTFSPAPEEDEVHAFLKPLPLGEAAAHYNFLEMINRAGGRAFQ